MIFISSPFSAPASLDDKSRNALEEQRFVKAREFTALMLVNGYQVFSPIVYTYQMARMFKMPGDAAHWERFNAEFVRRSEAMFVLRLPGWDQSKGVQFERKLAKLLSIPIIHWNTEYEEVEQELPQVTPKK